MIVPKYCEAMADIFESAAARKPLQRPTRDWLWIVNSQHVFLILLVIVGTLAERNGLTSSPVPSWEHSATKATRFAVSD